MGAIFGGPKISAPPPPPPPPNPPSPASASVGAAGARAQQQAIAAAGSGFDNTLLTSGQGAASPSTGQKQLTGK